MKVRRLYSNKLVPFLGFTLLFIGLPLLLLMFMEGLLIVFDVNVDVEKTSQFKIGVPQWASNDVNFTAIEDMYHQIVNYTLPPKSLEWMNYFVEADYVLYKMKPDISVDVINTANKIELKKEMRIHIETNKDGYRTKTLPVEKPENSCRIVCLGDSTTFGWGVNQNERFSYFLEESLNEDQSLKTYDVMNFGIPGYTIYHGIQTYLHYVQKYHPDFVIVTFGANDGRLISETVKTALFQPSSVQRLQSIFRHFHTYRFFRKHLLRLAQSKSGAENKDTAVREIKKVPFISISEYKQYVRQFIEITRKNNSKLILLGLCCPADYLARMNLVAREHTIPFMDGMHVLIQALPEIEAGNLYPELAEYYRRLYGDDVLTAKRIYYVTNDTCHPNILGHRILADKLRENYFENFNAKKLEF